MAKIDESGQLYIGVSSNFGMDTGWAKGTLNAFVDFKGSSITQNLILVSVYSWLDSTRYLILKDYKVIKAIYTC